MLWTVDGNAVMQGARVVKQCATVEDAEAYVAELTGTAVQLAAGKTKPKAKMGKNGKPLPPWLQPKGAKDDDDADDAPAGK